MKNYLYAYSEELNEYLQKNVHNHDDVFKEFYFFFYVKNTFC